MAPRATQEHSHTPVEDSAPQTMASVVTVLVCVALPLVFSYRNAMTGENDRTAHTAQNVHFRRRVQHAASGIVICVGYQWIITERWTGTIRVSKGGFGLFDCSDILLLFLHVKIEDLSWG